MRRIHILPAIFLAVLFVGKVSQSFAQNYWTSISSPTSENLNKAFFLDSIQGWVVGDHGTIFKTTNGGTSWITLNTQASGNLVDIHMVNDRIGWTLSLILPTDTGTWFGTYVLNTTNGGASWKKDEHNNQYFQAVNFIDSLHGWIGGLYGILLGTSDGGRNWFNASVDSSNLSNYAIHTIRFFSPQYGYTVGGLREMTGVIRRTTNAGSHWTIQGIGDELFDLHTADSINVLCVGGGLDDGAGVANTSNGGSSWSFHYVGYFGQAKSLSFRTPAEGWATLSFTGTCMYTLDFGRTWKKKYTPDTSAVFHVTFPDSGTGYMVGASGSIFKYTPPAITMSTQQGWNLVSVPVNVPDTRTSILFPASTSQAFSYDGGYAPVETLSYGKGYWLKFGTTVTMTMKGTYRLFDTIDVRPKWNIIGSISEPIPTSLIVQIPDSLVVSQYYEFNNGYYAVDTLQPGRGYWVKMKQSGKLVPVSSSAQQQH